MVGRTLEGNVQGDFNAERSCLGDQPLKILERSELWVYRFVAAFAGANGPRASRVIGLANRVIISPFSKRFAYGMNRWQVKHVETHFCDARQLEFTIFEGPVLAGFP